MINKTTKWNIAGDSIEKIVSRIKSNINVDELKHFKYLHVNMDNTCKNRNSFSIILNDLNIKFYIYYIDYAKEYNNNLTTYNNYLIVYQCKNNDNIYAIFDKNSGAKTILRKIFNYNENNKVNQVNMPVDNKIIIWLIQMAYSGYNTNYKNKLTIDSIAGIKGSTNDSENNVSINGNDTINMLSSLSFLLESKNMKEIIIHLSYKKEHNIKLCLSINNTLQIRSYLGTFDDMYYFNEYGENCVDFLPILLVYCELLPVLIKWFKKNIDIRDVNIKYLYHKFCKKIIDNINYKINKRIEEIK